MTRSHPIAPQQMLGGLHAAIAANYGSAAAGHGASISTLLSRLHRILKHHDPSHGHLRSRPSLVMQMVFLLVQNLQIAESISPDDIATEFAALKELKRTEEDESFDKVEVLEGNGVDFGELDPVEQGIIPQAILDEVNYITLMARMTRDGWDEATLKY
ncbi:hypothetical protein DFJ58DRAFT_845374 [Suillus subalutaceus]|uniref:uncharacterized protein n=1 Tax=Suillus subalutaceus TaxID=48586 RepID=UPI001B8830FA|nr:uncharacterized protein DFJ58DRAFT_845374 [Suillus subalutaceus]KAG1840369.1 hypothetical protein DFJ58DRAFT_845374 [Suillus subalutaceus]